MPVLKIIPVVFVASAAFVAVPGVKAQTSGKPAEAPTWAPHVDFEFKPGTQRNIGESDFFVPLAQDHQTLFFASLRGRLDNDRSREGNFGLGARRMMGGGWNLGAYGYFDRRRTENGNHFNQVTLGGEALGADWDLRGNVYIPQGDRARSFGGVTTGGGVSSASLSGTTVQVVTSAATATTREERALKGFDAEVGWRLPVYALESRRQLRVYLGGYRFHDDLVRLSGPRARAEFQLADLQGLWRGAELTLGAEWQRDQARGSQSFLSVRFRVPLGGSANGGTSGLSAQQRRMAAPVIRDIDIVTQARTSTVTTAPGVVETASALANGQSLTVLDSATTTGAALPGAVAAAGANSTVVLSGTFNTSAITAMQPGQTLMGAGTLTVATPSGRTATLTTSMATITGAVPGNAATVALANNTTLRGLTITNVATGVNPNPFAVEGNGVTGATVANNVLTSTGVLGGGNSFGLRFINNSSNLTIRDNTITAAGAAGISAYGLQIFNTTNVLVTGNTLSATSGNTSGAIAISDSSFQAGSTGNTITAGTCSSAGVNTGSVGLTGGGTCP